MATNTNVIKLKRSNVPTLVPKTIDVDLGELAVNTYDGKVYFKKYDGASPPVIETIVTTHAQVTGSIELTVAVSSSHMLIDKRSTLEPTTSTLFTIRLDEEDVVNVDRLGMFSLPPKTDELPNSTGEGAIAMSGSNMWIYI
jgi:hypothetical protein